MDLSGFVVYCPSKSRLKPYLSVASGGVTFSKAAVDLLGRQPYIEVFINQPGKAVAIKACQNKSENSLTFFKPSNRAASVRKASVPFKTMLGSLAEKSPTSDFVVFGSLAESGLMIFDFGKTEPIKRRYRRLHPQNR